jgi:hypothetical protein
LECDYFILIILKYVRTNKSGIWLFCVRICTFVLVKQVNKSGIRLLYWNKYWNTCARRVCQGLGRVKVQILTPCPDKSTNTDTFPVQKYKYWHRRHAQRAGSVKA